MTPTRLTAVGTAVLLGVLAAACDAPNPPSAAAQGSRPRASRTPRSPSSATPPSPQPTPAEPSPSDPLAAVNKWVTRRPSWLGKRVLPKRPDGFGIVGPTPRILRNRRLATIDFLPPPKSKRFTSHIGPVPASVVKRSTYRSKCPVTLNELSYITMTFWGFDHRAHTGEMIVNSGVAHDVVSVFEKLYRAHFPMEEMRVTTLKEQRAAPTGDTDNTSSFECRPVTLGTSWSEHSYGLAIDINPFQNPYVRGDLVAPELARAYRDRDWHRPGMIFDGDVVTQAFADLGWGWGGHWNTLKDWMHFSQNGH
jgi:D-alanyl-D-alanine carboxypeptidase